MSTVESEKIMTPDIVAYEAMKHLEAENYQQAISDCSEAVANFGPNRNCLLIMARGHIFMGEYGFAEDALNAVLKLDPEHPAAWAMLGEVYYRQGKTTRLEYCKNRLESIFPALAESYENGNDEYNETVEAEGEELAEKAADKSRNDEIETGSTGENGITDNDSDPFVTEPPPEPVPADNLKTTRLSAPDNTMVPLEDLYKDIQKQIAEAEGFSDRDEAGDIVSAKIPESDPEPEIQKTGLKLELFETATFADICYKQGKFEKALNIYKKLLNNSPDDARLREKIRIIESKIGSR